MQRNQSWGGAHQNTSMMVGWSAQESASAWSLSPGQGNLGRSVGFHPYCKLGWQTYYTLSTLPVTGWPSSHMVLMVCPKTPVLLSLGHSVPLAPRVWHTVYHAGQSTALTVTWGGSQEKSIIPVGDDDEDMTSNDSERISRWCSQWTARAAHCY